MKGGWLRSAGQLGLVALVIGLATVSVLQCRSLRDERQITARFHEIWLDRETIFKGRFLGVPTLQNPMDVWITQEILHEVKPDVLVETGTFRGGSAALWATLLAQINPGARVITIDVEDRTKAARRLPIVRDRVDFLFGSSIDPAIVAEVRRRVRGKRVLVILDSLHTKDHVLAELNAYAPMVPVGSYVIVQDSHVNGHPLRPDWGPGPWEAIAEFTRTTDAFVSDHSRERMLMTNNPNGFLKRVR